MDAPLTYPDILAARLLAGDIKRDAAVQWLTEQGMKPSEAAHQLQLSMLRSIAR